MSFIKRLSLRNSFQQRQSIHQDRRRTIRAIPFFQDFKIAIIGDECVGKSNIAMRCAGKEIFIPEHEPTIEDEYNCKVQFTFRLPAPLVDENISNGGEGDSNELIKSNPKGDIYGYKQMAHDLEIIPQELRNYMKLDDTLHSIIQQKREKEEEMKKALEEKQKKKFSLFKKKSNTDSPQKTHHDSSSHHQEEGEFGRQVNEEEDFDDYLDELLSDVVYNFEQDIICRVTIVDTSGRSEIRKEATDLSSMDGYLLVFDMNNKASFAKIQQFIDECKNAYYENPVRKNSDAALSHNSSSTRLSISSTSNTSSATTNSSSTNINATTTTKPSFLTTPVHDNPPMVLIMNKCDQKPSALKTINAEYGYALGDTHHFPFYVTSASENVNIQEALEALLSEIIKKNIEEGVYETQSKSLPQPTPTESDTSKTNSRNFKFENQNISISSNATDYTPDLVTFSVGNGVLIPQSPPEKKIVRQSVSATLRKYVVQQFKKK